MKRKSKQQRVRRCPDCGDRHTRAEGCIDEDDEYYEPEPEDEAFGLGAFIGSLMAGLSAFAEHRRRRQRPVQHMLSTLGNTLGNDRRCHFCQRSFTHPDDLQRYRNRAWDGPRLICADCVTAVECEPEVIDVEYEVIEDKKQ